MRAFWRRRSPFAARRALRALEGIEVRLAEQNSLLRRLADHIAPEIPQTEPELHGIDYLNDREMGQVIAYTEKTRQDLGRDPTEDEILQYLADEATEAMYRGKAR